MRAPSLSPSPPPTQPTHSHMCTAVALWTQPHTVAALFLFGLFFCSAFLFLCCTSSASVYPPHPHHTPPLSSPFLAPSPFSLLISADGYSCLLAHFTAVSFSCVPALDVHLLVLITECEGGREKRRRCCALLLGLCVCVTVCVCVCDLWVGSPLLTLPVVALKRGMPVRVRVWPLSVAVSIFYLLVCFLFLSPCEPPYSSLVMRSHRTVLSRRLVPHTLWRTPRACSLPLGMACRHVASSDRDGLALCRRDLLL